MATPDRPNLLDLDLQALARLLEELDERPFRLTQIIQWVHQLRVTDFQAMTNLSKALRGRLEERFEIRPPRAIETQKSSDGTLKWALEVDSSNNIETVFIPETGRGTLCVSSQVGCPLDCRFCATAQQGFNRNLTIGEIIGQVWHGAEVLGQGVNPDSRPLTNVVMMGMGEPLLNFTNVVGAIELMLHDHAYGLGHKRVTLSTAGHVPGIVRLAETLPVALAISLHAPLDALRSELVPLNRTYDIAALMDACRYYATRMKSDHITFEYIMLEGVNDSQELARELVRVLRGVPAKVNLIPYNPVPGLGYRRSSIETINAFRAVLNAAGIITVTRKTRGDDIDAACGQLAGKVAARAARHRREAPDLAELATT